LIFGFFRAPRYILQATTWLCLTVETQFASASLCLTVFGVYFMQVVIIPVRRTLSCL